MNQYGVPQRLLPLSVLGKVASGPLASPCLLWLGAVSSGGYGRMRASGKESNAHRVIYEREVGTVPDGMLVDHLCKNRRCINPQHLEAVTPAENQHRSAKLTWAAVASIRTKWLNGTPTKKIAAEFGISESHVRNVGSGRYSWRKK